MMLVFRIIFAFQRRGKWKCLFLVFLISILLICAFAVYYSPKAKHLMELHKCPACFGSNLCHDFYSARVVIDNDGMGKKLSHFINAKNVYYGNYRDQKIVLKKLGSTRDLKDLDDNLCEVVKNDPKDDCHLELLPKIRNLRKRIANLIVFKPYTKQLTSVSSLTLCPNSGATDSILNKILRSKMWNSAKENVALANIYTLLRLNPEPVVIELLSDMDWFLPSYIGSCGRAAVYKYVGPTLQQIIEKRDDARYKDIYINIALQLLKAADYFTSNHPRFRVYFVDYSLDNICYDELNDQIVFVDLEHMILVDYKEFKDTNVHRMTKDLSLDKFILSTEEVCSNYISDVNILNACGAMQYILPESIYPEIETLVTECIAGMERFKTVDMLSKQLIKMLSKPSTSDVK